MLFHGCSPSFPPPLKQGSRVSAVRARSPCSLSFPLGLFSVQMHVRVVGSGFWILLPTVFLGRAWGALWPSPVGWDRSVLLYLTPLVWIQRRPWLSWQVSLQVSGRVCCVLGLRWSSGACSAAPSVVRPLVPLSRWLRCCFFLTTVFIRTCLVLVVVPAPPWACGVSFS